MDPCYDRVSPLGSHRGVGLNNTSVEVNSIIFVLFGQKTSLHRTNIEAVASRKTQERDHNIYNALLTLLMLQQLTPLLPLLLRLLLLLLLPDVIS